MRPVGMLIAVAMLLLLVTIMITPAAAEPLTDYRHIHVQVANDGGARFDTFGNDTYYIKCDGGGLNAMHVTADPEERKGQVTNSPDQSGTIYFTNTGGRGYNDEVILLLAVNGTIPDDFAVHIKSSGYRWSPGSLDEKEYVDGAVEETFTGDDFIYGPQIWRPSPKPDNYPIFDGQDMSDTENTFRLMFIDLGVGHIFGDENTTDLGAARVDYTFENLETFAAFDIYGYTQASNQDAGISWTNCVTGIGSSGYTVQGVPRVVTTLTIAPTSAVLGTGETLQFNATAYDQNDQVIPSASLLWSSSDETVGTVDAQTGLFTANAAGTTTVTIAGGDAAATAEVTVTEDAPEVASIAIIPQSPTVIIDKTLQFSTNASDADGRPIPGAEVIWSSSNETVGTIDSTGLFRGHAEGETTVTATSGEIVAETLVSVMKTPPPASITLDPHELSPLYSDETVQFAATAIDVSGAEMDGLKLTWTSSNETVGTVSEDGLFTALAAGNTSVKAAFGGVSDTANVTVQTAPDWTLALEGAGTETLNRSGFIDISTENPTSCTDSTGRFWEGASLSTLVGLVDDDDPNTLNETLVSKNYKITITYEKRGRDRTAEITSDKLSGDSVPVVANKLDGKEIRPGTYWPIVVKDGYLQYATVKKIRLDLPRPATVTVTPSLLALKEGQTGTFSAATLDQYGNTMPASVYNWTSSNGDVGTVDESGAFTTIKEGTTTVTASDNGVTGSATVRVIPASHEPAIRYVDQSGNGNFTTIQAAVNGVYDYDIIVVKNGTYNESVTVNKFLTIRSEHGPEETVVHAPTPQEDVFTVTVDDVTIEGFAIDGGETKPGQNYASIKLNSADRCTLENNVVGLNKWGIALLGAEDAVIAGNVFDQNGYAGVYMEDSLNTTIQENTFTDCNNGVYARNPCDNTKVVRNTISSTADKKGCSTGISLSARGNIIQENTISCARTSGMRLDGITETTVADNVLIGGSGYGLYGIYLNGVAEGNTFTGNTIDAYGRGIGLMAGYTNGQVGGPTNNVFSSNSIVNSSINAFYIAGDTTKNNVFFLNEFINNKGTIFGDMAQVWQSPTPVEYFYNGKVRTGIVGNYWDTCRSTDADGNGIVDTAYAITPANTENHPLALPVAAYTMGSDRSSVSVTPCTPLVTEGGTQTFTAVRYNRTGAKVAGAPFVWSSSNETVGTVDDHGIFSAHTPGRTYVTATSGGMPGITVVTVMPGGGALSDYNNIHVTVANDAGVRFNDFKGYYDNTYNIRFAGENRGLNALHISTDPDVTGGQVTVANTRSGVFYVTDTGGKGYQDDIILMFAVNGTVPRDFAVHVKASGYSWNPDMSPGRSNKAPLANEITYNPCSLDETFTAKDFIYDPQTWKPCGNANYPIHSGQNMTDTEDTFRFMFIDLNAGVLGANSFLSDLTDGGAVKVEYTIENLENCAAFNAYAYCANSNNGKTMVAWTNDLSRPGMSGYSVLGWALAPQDGQKTEKSVLDIPGCTVKNSADGTKNITVDTSIDGVTISGKVITIEQDTFDLVITTAGNTSVSGTTVEGALDGIRFDTKPIVLSAGDAGVVTGSIAANLTDLPEGAELRTTIARNASIDALSAFQLAASNDGLTLDAVAYTMNIEKTNLANGQDIADATIQMTVSPAWVEAHGGVDAVRIIRSAEDGTKEVLKTTHLGTDADGNMVFEAFSPKGLSIFGLTAVSATSSGGDTVSSHSSGSSGGGSSNVAAISGSIPAGESHTFAVSETAINRITVWAYDSIDDLLVTVQKASLPKDVPAPQGLTYQLIETALYHTDASAIDTVTLEFAVPTTWLKEHDLSTEAIVLLSYENDGWKPLKTTFVKEENDQALYSAETSGFSYFAIASGETASAAGQAGETETPTPVVTDTPTPAVEETTVPATTAPTQKSPVPWFLSLVAIGALFLVKRD